MICNSECLFFACRSTPEVILFILAGASTCFWTQGTEYLQQVTQNAQFELVHGTGDCLAGAFTYLWTQCTEYLQQVSQNAQFQLVHGMMVQVTV